MEEKHFTLYALNFMEKSNMIFAKIHCYTSLLRFCQLKIEFLYALRDESDIYAFTIFAVFSMLSSFSINCDYQIKLLLHWHSQKF